MLSRYAFVSTIKKISPNLIFTRYLPTFSSNMNNTLIIHFNTRSSLQPSQPINEWRVAPAAAAVTIVFFFLWITLNAVNSLSMNMMNSIHENTKRLFVVLFSLFVKLNNLIRTCPIVCVLHVLSSYCTLPFIYIIFLSLNCMFRRLRRGRRHFQWQPNHWRNWNC